MDHVIVNLSIALNLLFKKVNFSLLISCFVPFLLPPTCSTQSHGNTGLFPDMLVAVGLLGTCTPVDGVKVDVVEISLCFSSVLWTTFFCVCMCCPVWPIVACNVFLIDIQSVYFLNTLLIVTVKSAYT